MITPVLALFDNEFTLTAEESLMKRELFEIEEVLNSLGVKVETNNNFPPLKIQGPINPCHIKLNANKTSQFLTGLLIALPLLNEKCTIEVVNLASKPYIGITLDLVRQFGVKINWLGETLIEIHPSKYSGQDIYIEGDWSSAAVFLIAGAIAGEVTITELNLNSKQGDKAILEVLIQVGALIEYNSEQTEEYLDSSVALLPQNDILASITVKKKNLHPFEFDAKDTPDLVPYLAILAANCEGKSTIHNVTRLNFKESRRLDLIMKNHSQLNINCDLKNDALEIWGGNIRGGIFQTGNDHRMAMAGALASLTSEKEIIIDNQDCVKKSYPNFWNDFKRVLSN
jgi:3-phosphoshikimate 1-carboxyvinyltransferase